MSPKIFTIIRREYLTRVRSRAFLAFTILVPAVMAGYIFMVVKIQAAAGDVANRIAIVDLSHGVGNDLAANLRTDKLGDGQPKYQIEQPAADTGNLAAIEAGLRTRILAKQLDSYLVIPAEVESTRAAEYHSRNAGSPIEAGTLESRLQQVLTRHQLEEAGVQPAQITAAFRDVHLESLKVGATGESVERGQTFVLAYILVFMLYFSLIFYGISVMRSVTEEKMNRVSEILLSSVDATSLMLGKILGVAGVGLTQYLIWGVLLAGAGGSYLAASGLLAKYAPHAGIGLYVGFVVFYVLGYLVYSSLFAAVGAMVSSDQEAQQTAMPITFLLVIAFLLSNLVLVNPNGPAAVALSLFPFFAPMLMVMRMAISSPPLWQVATSIALMLATLYGLSRFTGKIYRVGILMTGKRPTLPELVRWLKYA